MDESAMDMTNVCSSVNRTKPELNSPRDKHELLLQENYELKNNVEVLARTNKELENELLNLNMKYCGKSELDMSVALDISSAKATYQENYELKKKVELLEKVNMELEGELNYLTQNQAKETTRFLNIKEELDNANTKIKRLESSLDEERLQSQRLLQESREVEAVKPNSNVMAMPDQELLNRLEMHIEQLEIQRESDQQLMNELVEEKETLLQKLTLLNTEKQALQSELSETKEHLDQKNTDLRNLNVTLESLREEKFLMQGEIQLLKVSDSNAPRGNSLFAEVEDNRQKVAAQREFLKMKYINLKKIVGQKQVENNKLKMEIVKIRREEKEDEKSVHHDYNTLIETYKQRVWELEERVKELEKKSETQPIMMSESDNSQWMWVNSMVENARKETRSLQEELDRRGSNYVTQGHQLLASQKENRKLKATIAKLQSDIDEMRLQLDTIKSVKKDEDQDGISPPATEVALEYQKQKVVRFKEALSKQVNTSKHNSSSSDPDTSLIEQDRSLKETNTNTSLVTVKEEDKENFDY
ncbi:protein Spindly-like [Macrosteles quadrilineatus]|uniref:protein Spindly-like n=1 Tax=Macrosteles quadrilineatus TaxID=74068 RepID=UPI0023E269E9|nr:protein Spindly-like [Macrosteles quadrilineatus]XP_054290866.1 protein Spindly-like [Macrosteles quadrilineatus]